MSQDSQNRYEVDYGCSYLLWLSLSVIGLIVINGAVVDLLLQRWQFDRPSWLDDPRTIAAIRSLAPFALLVFEYWVFDFFFDRWRKRPSR